MDYFEQVHEDSSQRATQEHSAQTSVQLETSIQQKDSGFESISEELTQIDTNMGNPLVLQTPLNEERIQKISRNEASPSIVPLNHVYVERQRLNLLSEEEYEETRSDTVQTTLVGETPSTSQIQALSRQQRVEVSSMRTNSKQSQDLKKTCKKIKARNEKLKAQTYAHYLKMAPKNQTRLMSAFEIKEVKM